MEVRRERQTLRRRIWKGLQMKVVDETVDMGNFTTISIDDMGELMVVYDDGDEMWEVPLDARKVLAELREFFDE